MAMQYLAPLPIATMIRVSGRARKRPFEGIISSSPYRPFLHRDTVCERFQQAYVVWPKAECKDRSGSRCNNLYWLWVGMLLTGSSYYLSTQGIGMIYDSIVLGSRWQQFSTKNIHERRNTKWGEVHHLLPRRAYCPCVVEIQYSVFQKSSVPRLWDHYERCLIWFKIYQTRRCDDLWEYIVALRSGRRWWSWWYAMNDQQRRGLPY